MIEVGSNPRSGKTIFHNCTCIGDTKSGNSMLIFNKNVCKIIQNTSAKFKQIAFNLRDVVLRTTMTYEYSVLAETRHSSCIHMKPSKKVPMPTLAS